MSAHMSQERRRAVQILCMDSGAGLLAGMTMLLLHQPLIQFNYLPANVLLFMGLANFIYAMYSGTLAYRTIFKNDISMGLIHLLITANGIWSLICIALIFGFWPILSVFGVCYLLLEGCFVAGLALVEYRWLRSFIQG